MGIIGRPYLLICTEKGGLLEALLIFIGSLLQSNTYWYIRVSKTIYIMN